MVETAESLARTCTPRTSELMKAEASISCQNDVPLADATWPPTSDNIILILPIIVFLLNAKLSLAINYKDFMFPYGMGWPGPCVPPPGSYPGQQQYPPNVDWASLAKQWIESNHDNTNNVTTSDNFVSHLAGNNVWDPSIPPPSYFHHLPPPPATPSSVQPYTSDNLLSIHNNQQTSNTYSTEVFTCRPPPPPPPLTPPPPPPQVEPSPHSVYPISSAAHPTYAVPSQFNAEVLPMLSQQCTLPPLISGNQRLPLISTPLLPTPSNCCPQPFLPCQWTQQQRLQHTSEPPEIVADLRKKRLPAWIRDGLEKIEQEKNKKIVEQQQNWEADVSSDKRKFYESDSTESRESSDSRSIDKGNSQIECVSSDHVEWQEKDADDIKVNNPLLELAPEEIQELKMTVLRKMMTELLLSITNSEMRILVESERNRVLRSKDAEPKIVATSAALSNLANEVSSPESSVGNCSSNSSPLIVKEKILKESHAIVELSTRRSTSSRSPRSRHQSKINDQISMSASKTDDLRSKKSNEQIVIGVKNQRSSGYRAKRSPHYEISKEGGHHKQANRDSPTRSKTDDHKRRSRRHRDEVNKRHSPENRMESRDYQKHRNRKRRHRNSSCNNRYLSSP
ncbi:hypothetical protein GJ496_008445 [Pomphorhynchus laevis]|nr:hypothetical protein GJ496_008445 [Pomphorhynchus laevis]